MSADNGVIKLDAPVQGLTLKVVRSGELESTSQDIFAGRKGQQTELELIATLQAKLGNHQVLKVAPTDDPSREIDFIMRPRTPHSY